MATAWTASVGTANSSVSDGTTTTYKNYQTLIASESGLVAYYKLDETSGTTITDSKGTFNGTINGTYSLNQPSLIAGNVGSSIKFNNGYVQVPAGATTNPMTGLTTFSIEMWFRPDLIPKSGFNPTSQQLFDCKNNTNFTGLTLYTEGSNLGDYRLTFVCGNGTSLEYHTLAAAGSSMRLSPSQANHLVFTCTGTTYAAYINGKKTVSGGMAYSPVTATSSNLGIAGYATGGGYFNGSIDEVAIYNTILTDNQIANHYQTGGDFVSAGDYVSGRTQTLIARSTTNFPAFREITQTQDEYVNRIINPSPQGSQGISPYYSSGSSTGNTALALVTTDGRRSGYQNCLGYTGTITTSQNTDITYTSNYSIPPGIAASGGLTVTVLASVKVASASVNVSDCRIGITFSGYSVDATGGSTTSQFSSPLVVATGGWQDLAFTYTLPTTSNVLNSPTNSIRVRTNVRTVNQTQTVTHYADCYALIYGNYTGSYFDGYTSNARWIGAVNYSESYLPAVSRQVNNVRLTRDRPQADDEILNLIPNPSAETNASGWYAYGAIGTDWTSVTSQQITTDSAVGSAAFQATYSGSLRAGSYFEFGNTGVNEATTPGQRFYMRIAVKVTGIASPITLSFGGYWQGQYTQNYADTKVVQPNTWTVLEGYVNAPLGVTAIRGIYLNGSVAAGTTMTLTGDAAVMAINPPYTPGYFDGSTNSPSTHWLGTTNSSRSGLTLSSKTVSNNSAPGLGQNYETVVLASAPVSRYKMNETSGTTIIDDISGYNATISGSGYQLNQRGLLGGNTGNSIQFGSSGGATASSSTNAMNGLTTFSIEMILNLQEIDYSYSSGWEQYLIDNTSGASASARGFSLLVSRNGVGANEQGGIYLTASYLDSSGTATYHVPSHRLSQNQTIHVVITYDGTTSTFYIDGRPYVVTRTFVTPPSAQLCIGRTQGNAKNFRGLMSQLAFYNRVLTGNEVMNHYAAMGDFASAGVTRYARYVTSSRSINQEVPIRDERYNPIFSPRGIISSQWSTYAGSGPTVTTTANFSDGPTTDLNTCIKKVVTLANYTSLQQNATGGDSSSGTRSISSLQSTGYLQVVPGGNFSVSTWFKGDTTQGIAYIIAYFRDGNGTFITAKSSTSKSVTANQWIQVSQTFTVPANAEWATFYLVWDNLTSFATYTAYYTGFIMSNNVVASTFFDGNSSNARWIGTANQSGSYLPASNRQVGNFRNTPPSNQYDYFLPNDETVRPVRALSLRRNTPGPDAPRSDFVFTTNFPDSVSRAFPFFRNVNDYIRLQPPYQTIEDRVQSNSSFNRIVDTIDKAIYNDETVRLSRLLYLNRLTRDQAIAIDSITQKKIFEYLNSLGYIFICNNQVKLMIDDQALAIAPIDNTEDQFIIFDPKLGFADFQSNDY